MNNEILGLSENRDDGLPITGEVFGNKMGFFARLFGCWHLKLSRPITVKNETYCACSACGARIRFDTETLKTIGGYYYPPNQSLYSDN